MKKKEREREAYNSHWGSLMDQKIKNLLAAEDTEDRSSILRQQSPLEQEMAIHSIIFAWKIPWIEEADGLQSKWLQRVRHN